VKKARIADLSGGALRQLGLDPALGLYSVEVGLIPPANPIGWSALVIEGAAIGGGELRTPTPAITYLVDTLAATPGFPGMASAGIADWIVAAEAYCRAQSGSGDCIADPSTPGTEISDPTRPDAEPEIVSLSPYGRSLLRVLERFGAGPAKSWPIAVDGRFNQGWGCTDTTAYNYEPRNGCENYHNGIDIGWALNTKMLAVAAGTVTMAGPSSFSTVSARFPVQLWLIIIKQDDGYTAVYGHTGNGTTRGGMAPTVRKGDQVRAGQLIGYIGLTGHTTGPHIHFTMYRGSRLRDIDPCAYLPAMPSGRPACRQGPDAYP
jgi:murein DD-endopeptidase MepM/ murein hydrolase activator NlpD